MLQIKNAYNKYPLLKKSTLSLKYQYILSFQQLIGYSNLYYIMK